MSIEFNKVVVRNGKYTNKQLLKRNQLEKAFYLISSGPGGIRKPRLKKNQLHRINMFCNSDCLSVCFRSEAYTSHTYQNTLFL